MRRIGVGFLLLFLLESGGGCGNGAGTAGDASSDELDVPDSAPDLLQHVARYCILVTSCIDGIFPSVGTCIWEMERYYVFYGEGLDEAVMECVFNAGHDCHQVFLCVYHGGVEPEPCNDSSFESTCEGNVAVTCSQSAVARTDCSSLPMVPESYAMTCLVEPPYDAECVGESCEGFESRCNGDMIELCDGELFQGLVGLDCSDLIPSSTCEETAEGGADCVGTGPSCAPDGFVSRCEGDSLIECLGGKEAAVDCSRLGEGYTCRTIESEADCAGAGDECVLEADEYTDACSGTVLSYCHAGVVESVDCLSLGFSTCVYFEAVGLARCQ